MGRKMKATRTSSPKRQSARLAQSKKDVPQVSHPSSLEESDSASSLKILDEDSSASSTSKELREAYEQIRAKGTYMGRSSSKTSNMELNHEENEGSTIGNHLDCSYNAQMIANPISSPSIFGHGVSSSLEKKKMAIFGKNNTCFQHVSGLAISGNDSDNLVSLHDPDFAILGNDVDNTNTLRRQMASLTRHERDNTLATQISNSSLEDFPPLPTGHAYKDANKDVDKAKVDDMAKIKANQNADMATRGAYVATQEAGKMKDSNQRNGSSRGRRPWFTPTMTEPTNNWKGLFAPNIGSKLKLKTYPYKKENGRRIVEAPPEDTYLEGEKFWRNCLVGQFLGPPPPLHIIRGVINKAWRKYGEVEVKSNGRGLYIFKFETEFGINEVMQQLWHIYNRPLLLRRWEPNMEFVNFTFENVPIWVKFRNVPLSLWSPEGLSYVATHIGEPIQMDTTTEARINLEFARVCIEVNLEDELPDTINVRLQNGRSALVEVEYSWKPKKCNGCKMVGHTIEQCPSNKKPSHAQENSRRIWVEVGRKGDEKKILEENQSVNEIENAKATQDKISGIGEENEEKEVEEWRTMSHKKDSRGNISPQRQTATTKEAPNQNKFSILEARDEEEDINPKESHKLSGTLTNLDKKLQEENQVILIESNCSREAEALASTHPK